MADNEFEGSSPRVRGKPGGEVDNAGGRRLIPACAGKTPWQNLPMMTDWAHPRVCGENQRLARLSYLIRGSSPRVRGKLDSANRNRPRSGLIPACAGKTLNDLEF